MAKVRTYDVTLRHVTDIKDGSDGSGFSSFSMELFGGAYQAHKVAAASFDDLERQVRDLQKVWPHDSIAWVRVPRSERKPAGFDAFVKRFENPVRAESAAQVEPAAEPERRATNRPGDMAAIYAEENGVSYSDALVACNMD